jgi:hypothetical protein
VKPFDRVLAVSQLFILAAWEILTHFAFGWNVWIVAAVWFVGLWTFNVLTATAVRTYYKLIEPGVQINNTNNVVELRSVGDTPEDVA